MLKTFLSFGQLEISQNVSGHEGLCSLESLGFLECSVFFMAQPKSLSGLPSTKRVVYQSDSAASHAISDQIDDFDGPILVITQDSITATKVLAELQFFLKPTTEIVYFPDWETLIYDSFSPHENIISARLKVLNQLQESKPIIIVASCTTLLHRLPTPNFVSSGSFLIRKEQELVPGDLRKSMHLKAYREVSTVIEHGEFAIRGSIVDIFPMGSATPFRIDLFDNIVDSIRTFDPETQRSLEKKNSVEILPGREFPLSKSAINHFKNQWHLHFSGNPEDALIYRDISKGLVPAGLEYYLKFFFEEPASIFDHLPKETKIFSENITEALKGFWEKAQQRFESLRYDLSKPILPVAEILLNPNDFLNHLELNSFSILEELKKNQSQAFRYAQMPNVRAEKRSKRPFSLLEQLLKNSANRVLIVAETQGRKASIESSFKEANLKPLEIDTWEEFKKSDFRFAITVGLIQRGFSNNFFHVITERELFGEEVFSTRKRKKTLDNFADLIVKNLSELKPGDSVVHIDHGVGRYEGLSILKIENQDTEFLVINYAEDSKLYVPVSSLELISRYSGIEGLEAPLHRLGGETWKKEKKRAVEQINDVAAELLDLYSKRLAAKGFSHQTPDQDYEEFARAFPFEETPDQEEAIKQVVADMLSQRPMDRLICGDVGFGKTEVAMRAAFIATSSGKQVVVLVPTTLLARQHEETFKDRFANTAANIASISRFKTSSEQKRIINGLITGKIDIVIGTHSLLQENLDFSDLGLLIIDEEHRFGVRQKEKINSLRAGVDILTMTATPIPRTLNMAISGLRDLSIIATPPERRLSIKTFINKKSDHVVKEAIQREILRGGQVFYLHNQVKTIEKTAIELQKEIPEASVSIAHGQMREQQLEQVMLNFHRKTSNVLVCTTIIETGLDIPNANTIIIERADKLGLAQIHQLRGRVGRSYHQAYAYLLTAPEEAMTPSAIKRLQAISESEDLGAGFILATHDLEIRGAGEILGDDQSGNIQNLGYSMFAELLDRAVSDIKSGRLPRSKDIDKKTLETSIDFAALIPETYLPDTHARLVLYKRIASLRDEEELKELQVEMIDRFGLFPIAVKNLFRLTSLKIQARTLGITKITLKSNSCRLIFGEQTLVDPDTIFKLLKNDPGRYKFNGGNELVLNANITDVDKKFDTAERLFAQLY